MQSLGSKLKYTFHFLKHKNIINLGIRMQNYKVFVTQPIPKEASDIMLENKLELTINDTTPLSWKKLIDSVRNCDALFCTLNEKIDKELLEQAGGNLKVDYLLFIFRYKNLYSKFKGVLLLKVIATCSVGYDHIDLKECGNRNIPQYLAILYI
jgi:lactate dehydrogenase-like 2-hydroxyacid dehydrogenase